MIEAIALISVVGLWVIAIAVIALLVVDVIRGHTDEI